MTIIRVIITYTTAIGVESAAIADILSVDISPFENNKYFPKDMYFYKKVEQEDRGVYNYQYYE